MPTTYQYNRIKIQQRNRTINPRNRSSSKQQQQSNSQRSHNNYPTFIPNFYTRPSLVMPKMYIRNRFRLPTEQPTTYQKTWRMPISKISLVMPSMQTTSTKTRCKSHQNSRRMQIPLSQGWTQRIECHEYNWQYKKRYPQFYNQPRT